MGSSINASQSICSVPGRLGSCRKNSCFFTNQEQGQISIRLHLMVCLWAYSGVEVGVYRIPFQAESIVCDVLWVSKEVLCRIGRKLCKLKPSLWRSNGHLHMMHCCILCQQNFPSDDCLQVKKDSRWELMKIGTRKALMPFACSTGSTSVLSSRASSL